MPSYRDNLATGLLEAMEADDRVVVLGAGVADPKGVFGTTLEAHRRFPSRVIETPLSENMLTGACAGLAANGWRPVLVHARFEFALLGMEHLVNTIAKWPWLHGGQRLPVVIRCIVGRGWGQGPTHSQSFHHWLAGVPGLRVLYPVLPDDVGRMLKEAILGEGPVVFIEPRRMYEISQMGGAEKGRVDAQIVTFGDAILDAVEAWSILKGVGVMVRVVPIQDMHAVRMWDSTIPIVVVDSEPSIYGANEQTINGMPHWRKLTSRWQPTPSAFRLEAKHYVDSGRIAEVVLGLLGKGGLETGNGAVRDDFKGPF